MTIDKYGNECLSDYFFSNCIVEALKAKMHDRSVRIIKRHVKGTIIPHFMWQDGKWLYDFGADHSIICPLLFRGYVRRRKNAHKRKNY